MDPAVQESSIRSVVGVLDDNSAVQSLLAQLNELGVGPDSVSVMMREGAEQAEQVPETQGSRVAGGAATGAAFGGLLGGLAGWMIAIGALAIPGVVVPGVGLVFGAGTLASLLTGIAVGAAAGGLVGALLGLGVPEEEARRYQQAVEHGRTLVTVHLTHGENEAPIVTAFEANGGYDVRVYETPAEAPSLQGRTPTRTRLAHSDHEETSGAAYLEDVRAPQEIPTQPAEDTQRLPAEDEVGELSAETGNMGSGAEGGYGDGEAREVAGEGQGPDDEGRF